MLMDDMIEINDRIWREVLRFPCRETMLSGEARYGVVHDEMIPSGDFIVAVGSKQYNFRHGGKNTICQIRRVK